ncbi:MAG: MinD/ParA family protein [Syntrophomonas sp.]|uniref:MinD/ParA family protein n=1 Tax=Syntrophomonas sp. TaxID=2053627 RepID=UPI00262689B1|nr:MinD/ParA family protein [Syntrophomonas sp.]MDD2510046.1 MinD/ParA family protein [Syntrophomonas sp.]MDD3878616.1 MinD/ParA family protein [Syntrophomonas sp.]MDD4626077.1 MinD/ParA family protein [Syntrophomonas sp.]
MRDQAEKLREMALNLKQEIEAEISRDLRHSRVVVISSGKGGVGKSTLALNLSIKLCTRGMKVILMDADMGLANLDVMLGLVAKYNIYHMVQEKKTLADITISGPEGLKIIPGGSGISELANLKENELKRILVELRKLDGAYDYMIIDTGAGISKSVMAFLLAADDIIVITTPEPTAITDAYSTIKNVAKNAFKGNIFLVVNRVANDSEGILVAEKFKLVCQKFLSCEIKILGHIENEPLIGEGIRRQKAFVQIYPRSTASRNINAIIDRMIEVSGMNVPDLKAKSGGIRKFIEKMAGLIK